jgi:hypothetical protein
MVDWMNTTTEIPDELFRLAKARASHSGINLKQFVTDSLLAQLASDGGQAGTTDPGWIKAFGGLADLAAETARIRHLIEDEFESTEPERNS